MIKINGLNKYFNKGKSNQIHVINNTSLTLPSKGLVSLLGDSGAGKTTLLNVIGGLDRFSSGDIEYDDQIFKKYNMRSIDKFRGENIGYIFQQYNLLPNYTVYENLSIQLEILGITDKVEQDKRIKYALEAVKLYKFRKKLAGQLSGGQMQRVAIARALVKKTKILIADEPTGNLDSKNSVEIMNILKNISKIALVLLVTHDKPLAEYYSDVIVELCNGQIKNIRNELNTSSKDIKNRLDYKVYLGDMNRQEDGEKIKTVVYSQEENPDISLTLIEIGGTYYIKSNVTIKNINDANVELVDGKFEENLDNQIEDKFEFDNSWYNDQKKYNPIKSFTRELKYANATYKYSSKKSKSFRFILIFIGLLLAFAVAKFYEARRIDTESIPKDQYAYSYNYNGDDLFINPHTNYNVSYGNKDNATFNIYKSYYSSKSYGVDLYHFNYNQIESFGIFKGKAPKNDNEVVIGKMLAETLKDKLKLDSYDQLFNCVVDSRLSICGISNINTDSIYHNNYKYLMSSYSQEYQDDYFSEGSSITNGCVEYEKYEILYGSDLNASSSQKDVLYVLSEDEYVAYKNNNEKPKAIGDAYYECTIRGVVALIDDNGNHVLNNESDVYLYKDLESIQKDIKPFEITTYAYSDVSKYTTIIKSDLNIISKNYTPIFAYYGNFDIGDIVDNYQVVGLFKFNNPDYTFTDCFNAYTYDYYKFVSGESRAEYIEIYDNETLDKINKDSYDFSLNAYDKEYKDYKKLNKDLNREAYISIAVLIAICIVYTYFTMRSRMISEIYEIGVFRNIGAKRSMIVKKYVAYSIISTLRTSFIGYAIGVLFIGLVLQFVYTTIVSQEYNLLLSPYPYLGVLLLFAITIIFGTLPVFTLLRKTPSEISAKYDI